MKSIDDNPIATAQLETLAFVRNAIESALGTTTDSLARGILNKLANNLRITEAYLRERRLNDVLSTAPSTTPPPILKQPYPPVPPTSKIPPPPPPKGAVPPAKKDDSK